MDQYTTTQKREDKQSMPAAVAEDVIHSNSVLPAPALQFKPSSESDVEESNWSQDTSNRKSFSPPPFVPNHSANTSQLKVAPFAAIQKKAASVERANIAPFQMKKSSSSSNGLPEDVRGKMENAFQTDFSTVNIQKDSQQATDVGALAYTQGNDIHFAPGQFNPSTQGGQELIGHELTHVVQQRNGQVKPTTAVNGMPVNDNHGLEAEADTLGKKAAAAEPVSATINTTSSPSASKMEEEGVKQGWGIPDWMKDAGSAVLGVGQDIGSAIVSGGSSLLEGGKHIAQGIGNSAMSIGGGIVDGVQSVGSGLIEGTKSIGGGIINGVQSVGGGLMDGLGRAGSGILDGLQSTGSGILEGGGQIWDGIQSGAGNLFSDPLGALATMGGGLVNGLGTMGGGLLDGIQSAGGGILGGIGDIGGGLWNGLLDVGGGVLDGVKNIGGGLLNGALDVGGGLLSGIGDLFVGGLNGAYSAFDALMELGPGMLENLIGPDGKTANASDIPAFHVMMEYMAHNVAYNPSALNDKTQSAALTAAGYDIDNYSVRVGPNGFQAVLIRPLADRADVRPILAFRGTLSLQGVSTDLDVQQVGQHEYNANEAEINALVEGEGPVDVTGHSLGGAMAQIFTARHPDMVRHLVTFQAPGISASEVEQGQERIDNLRAAGESTPTVAHHIVDNDLVDTAGTRNLDGQVFEHHIDNSFNVVDAHTSVIFLSPEFAEARAQYGITDEVVKSVGWELRNRNAEIEEFDRHPNVVRRVIFETIRKTAGVGTAGLRALLRKAGIEYDFGEHEYEDSDNEVKIKN